MTLEELEKRLDEEINRAKEAEQNLLATFYDQIGYPEVWDRLDKLEAEIAKK